MRDPHDLYSVSPEAFDNGPVPVLVHALRGAMDAGHAGRWSPGTSWTPCPWSVW